MRKYQYDTEIVIGDTDGEFKSHLDGYLGSMARVGWRFKTCRRLVESPFTLLVIMERKQEVEK